MVRPVVVASPRYPTRGWRAGTRGGDQRLIEIVKTTGAISAKTNQPHAISNAGFEVNGPVSFGENQANSDTICKKFFTIKCNSGETT